MNTLYFTTAGLMVVLTLFSAINNGAKAKTADEGAGLVVGFIVNCLITYLLFYAGFHL